LIVSFASFGGVKEYLNTLVTFGMSAFVLRGLGMSRFRAEAKKMVEVLGMKWAPVAGKFSVDAEEAGDSARKLSICEAFDVVKRENVVLTLSKENCVCQGGRHFTGLEIVPLETIAPTLTTKKHRVYESMNTALASISKQPRPVKRGDSFTLGPLEKFETDPDLVFLFANPAQAESSEAAFVQGHRAFHVLSRQQHMFNNNKRPGQGKT
jgi:uncharacterized protein (DUF169 family)